jgi:hypothetical protein
VKISTVTTIYWVATAAFWSLSIADWVTPGKAPAPLSLFEELFLLTLVAAWFYGCGSKRKASTPDYEMSK